MISQRRIPKREALFVKARQRRGRAVWRVHKPTGSSDDSGACISTGRDDLLADMKVFIYICRLEQFLSAQPFINYIIEDVGPEAKARRPENARP